MAAKKASNYTVSSELDELSCELMGQALDLLAEGEDVNVLLAVADTSGNVVSYEFADDGEEACLTGAHEKVHSLVRSKGDATAGLGAPHYYALCYEGAIADDDGTFAEALIMEFGEKNEPAFSAFSLFEGRGTGDGFAWTDPAPAGEVDTLLR